MIPIFLLFLAFLRGFEWVPENCSVAGSTLNLPHVGNTSSKQHTVACSVFLIQAAKTRRGGLGDRPMDRSLRHHLGFAGLRRNICRGDQEAGLIGSERAILYIEVSA
jgi:hypothetical protein